MTTGNSFTPTLFLSPSLTLCARRDALVIIFLSNNLFLSVESFFKINYYINRNSNITKYHDNNNYFIIIKYYFIYYDNIIYINNTNT